MQDLNRRYSIFLRSKANETPKHSHSQVHAHAHRTCDFSTCTHGRRPPRPIQTQPRELHTHTPTPYNTHSCVPLRTRLDSSHRKTSPSGLLNQRMSIWVAPLLTGRMMSWASRASLDGDQGPHPARFAALTRNRALWLSFVPNGSGICCRCVFVPFYSLLVAARKSSRFSEREKGKCIGLHSEVKDGVAILA